MLHAACHTGDITSEVKGVLKANIKEFVERDLMRKTSRLRISHVMHKEEPVCICQYSDEMDRAIYQYVEEAKNADDYFFAMVQAKL